MQALSAPISSLSLVLVQTQAVRWKAATPEQLTGAHLYSDIAKSGYLFHGFPVAWTTSTEAANLPLLSHMRRLPKEDPTTAPPDKPTTGVPNNQPPTAGTPSKPPQTMRPHHHSSRPENSRASEPSFIGQNSGHYTTQTQTSEVRWAACFSGHWVVTSMFA